MAISIWDPMAPMARLSHDMDMLFRRSMPNRFDTPETAFMPPADVDRDGEDVVVRMEIPGMNEDDINIDVETGRLTISGQREETTTDEESHVRELRRGQFRRDFALPQGVTADDVNASYDKGVLEIRISGAARGEPAPQKIPVQRAQEVEQ